MLKFFGNGSAFNTELTNNSAFYKYDTRKHKKILIIDCGSSVFKAIKNSKVLDDVYEINVLITHTHADHVGSLADLVLYNFYVLKKKLNIFIHPNIKVKKILKENGVEKNMYNAVPIEENCHTTVDSVLSFTPFLTKHVDNLTCLSFSLSISDSVDPNKYIWYSGDSSVLPNMVNFLNIYHYYFIDTSMADYDGNVHLSLRKLTESVPLEKRHKFYCMHLDEKFNVEWAKDSGFNVVETI